jgi:hypothetical protein
MTFNVSQLPPHCQPLCAPVPILGGSPQCSSWASQPANESQPLRFIFLIGEDAFVAKFFDLPQGMRNVVPVQQGHRHVGWLIGHR